LFEDLHNYNRVKAVYSITNSSSALINAIFVRSVSTCYRIITYTLSMIKGVKTILLAYLLND